MRTLFSLLLLLAVQASAVAQTPATPQQAPGAAALQAAREAQPPEQSGQAQQLMKEARVELDRAADALDSTVPASAASQIGEARDALEQFDQSLDQLDQSVPGYVPRALADALHTQVTLAEQLLNSDPAAATDLMREMALRVTDLTAEAALLIGRELLGSDGAPIGNISNVLISPRGRILALIIDRAAAGSNRQFTVSWAKVTVRGRTLNAGMARTDTDRLPDYIAQ